MKTRRYAHELYSATLQPLLRDSDPLAASWQRHTAAHWLNAPRRFANRLVNLQTAFYKDYWAVSKN